MMGDSLHCFPPLADASSRMLILGSMPGEESLRQREYYANPHNAFWRIIAAATGRSVPGPYEVKKQLLREHGIALWDVIKTCRRRASSDANISDIAPNDIPALLARYPGIRLILLNGRTAEKIFLLHCAARVTVPHVYLPSTSPAHASLSECRKAEIWCRHMLVCAGDFRV